MAATLNSAEGDDKAKPAKSDADLGSANVMSVELFYKEKPQLTKQALLKELRSRLPKIEPVDGKEDSDLKAFVHPDHQVTYKDDVKVPAQCLVCDADKPPELEKYKDAIQQSWSFPKCAETVKACKHTVLITDLMANGLPYKERFRIFRDVLASTIKAAPPVAIYWQFSDHFSTPDQFLKDLKEEGDGAGFQSALNVRFFNISNQQQGDMIMDTRGLSILGLPDFQCHFRNLEPKAVAQKLFNLALYVFEKGDVIASGHTVQGLSAADKWKVQLEDSLLKPSRQVLDVNPGAPNAAGNRK